MTPPNRKHPISLIILRSWLLLAKKSPASQGFTLIESLMAILVLAVVISFIATPILITVGSRNQNRQTNQATQLAQRIMEEARSTLARQTTWTDGTTPPSGIPKLASGSSISGVAAPTGSASVCTAQPCNTDQVFGYDFDNDGTTDFYVQAFRTSDQQATGTSIVGFDLGVRVYPSTAVGNSGTTRTDLITAPANLGFRANALDPKRPLAAFYSSLYRGSQGTSLNIIAGLGSAATPTPTATSTPTPTSSTSPTPTAVPTLAPTGLPPVGPTPTP